MAGQENDTENNSRKYMERKKTGAQAFRAGTLFPSKSLAQAAAPRAEHVVIIT
jgi:hypothetical protein